MFKCTNTFDQDCSQELLNIELPPVEKGKKVVSPKRETFQPVNISNCNVSINYYNGKV